MINWNKNLIALRSLTSEHHATNINPTITNVTWFLGRRCNYDCSYCNPSIHNWTSPHIKLSTVTNFINQLSTWVSSQTKTFRVTLTGGEPFVHPDILEILKIIRTSDVCGDQLVAVTNGSMPLELYNQALHYISNLTISLHLERSESEIDKILSNVLALNTNFPKHWINVQVMCLPGKFEYLEKTVLPFLDKHHIKYTLRRIRPWLNEEVEEWQQIPKTQILKTQYDAKWISLQNENEKKFLDNNLEKIYQENTYYSDKELQWLEENIPTTNWQNIGLWNEDSDYFETNSDIMANNNRNKFFGWKCWVGIDSLNINDDGMVYKSVCRADGPLGNIEGEIKWPTVPVICNKQWCSSNSDQTIRKSKPNATNLVS